MKYVALIFLVLFAGSVQAEPDSKVRWLMNQPVSMFDWTIFQLSARLEEMFAENESVEKLSEKNVRLDIAFARYNWVENRIYIQITAIDAPATPEACEFVVKTSRSILLDDYGFGSESRLERATNFFDEQIRHEGGYMQEEQPDDLAQALASISIVRASVGEIMTGVSCFGELAGTDLNIEKNKF